MKDGEVSLHTLFQFKETGETDGKIEGIWEKTGELKHTQKLKAAGLWKE